MSNASAEESLRCLAGGTRRQRRAHDALERSGIFEKLSAYSPVLVGTVPLDLDVEGSDLDIVCHADDLDAFRERVEAEFSDQLDLEIVEREIGGWPSVVARFRHAGFDFELFAQARPVEEQPGYRHMLVEDRLLRLGGDRLREKVRKLKRAGLATEPAFARALGLDGDPYAVLMELSRLDAKDLAGAIDLDAGGRD